MNQDTTLATGTTTAEETFSLTELARVLHIELKLDSAQIARTVALLDEGNTIPFIARYRKEVTGTSTGRASSRPNWQQPSQ